MEKLDVITTRTGKPALWVGGGATTSKFSARFVLRNGQLAPAIFIARTGHRCNSGQALVPLQKGDIVIRMDGRRPASPDNPDIFVDARRIVGFGTDNTGQVVAFCEFVDVTIDDIPSSVWKGCEIYHNRDAYYFILNE